MGFSLKVMFEELEAILNSDSEDEEKIKILKTELQWWKEYAQDCGHLKLDDISLST